MHTGHILNNKLIDALNINIKHPFLILDENGNILSYNKEAKSLFSLKEAPGNIYDIFNESSSEKLNELIEKLNNTSPIDEYINIKLNNGQKVKCRLILNYYTEEKDNFVFCTFKEEEHAISPKGKTEVKVLPDDITSIIEDEEILKIIDEVKSLYPFTFIGKERLRKVVNKLDVLFWVKDSIGKYILINKKMAGSLGLSTAQLEGKFESSFIPPYLQKFHKSIEEYIKNSASTVVLEGIPLKGIAASEDYQTIEIPLVDADNKIIAFIGIARKEKSEEKKKAFTVSDIVIKDFTKPVAFIDNNELIKHSSIEFCKLFSQEFSDFFNIDFKKILPLKFSDKIKSFIKSGKDFDSIEIKNEGIIENLSNDFILILKKIYSKEEKSKEKKFEGISVLVEEKFTIDDLESLIKNRGMMFEILINKNPEPIFIYDRENLKFLEVNEAALSLYGYRREEFLQMDLTDLYTPDDIQTLLDSSSRKTIEGSFNGPFRHKRKDGTSVFVEISKISTTFEEREAHFNIIKDVTKNLELEKDNQLFKASFDNTTNLLFVTDASGFIKFVNRPVTEVLGINKDEIEQTSFTSLVKDEERGTINSTIFQSHITEMVTLTTEMKTSEGEFVEIELTATPIYDHNNEVDTFNIMAVVKEAEKEPEVKEVIKEVVVEKPVPVKSETDESGDSIKTEFLSSLFHEILTPINVILGFVEELTEGIESLSPEQKEASKIISQNRSTLLNTMNSIMEYVSLEKGESKVTPEEIGITQIIDKLQEDMDELAGTDDIEFAYGKISSSLRFISDEHKFQIFTSNLLKITAKLTKEKKLYFSAYMLDENRFMVSIKDSYSSVSNPLLFNLNTLFGKSKEGKSKDIGISKLTIKLTNDLLILLNGKFEIIDKGDDKRDCGFIFPVDITEFLEEKPVEETTEDEEFEEPVSFKETDEEPEETKIESEPEFEPESELEEEFESEEPEDEEELEEKTIESEEPHVEEVPEKTIEELEEESKEHLEQFDEEPEGEIEESEDEKPEVDLESHQEIIDDSVKFRVDEEPEDRLMDEFEREAKEEKAEKEKAEEEKAEEEPEEIKIPEEPEEYKRSEIQKTTSGKVDLSQLNCLYIEDQVDSQILFKVQMKELKDIKFAVSFEEALPLLDSHHFDFIVMDINLQGEYNGLDALKIIHKMPGFETIPIIAVTAYVLPGDKEKFIAAGFNDFISKPIFREKMIDSLEKIFMMQF